MVRRELRALLLVVLSAFVLVLPRSASAWVELHVARDDIRLTIDVPSGLAVMADEVDLIRAISNLLENAMRYGRSAPGQPAEVDLVASASAAKVAIELRDRGPGVSPASLGQLTKAFFRGDSARTAVTGAGLGLAIVEKNIQRMGGSLTLRNHSAGGFAATITLDRAP